MTPSFVIDALPDSAPMYRDSHAMVAVDVFRATSVIVTALANGHPVYPVGSLAEALMAAGRLREPLLAGEQQGMRPDMFDLDNSPAAMERLSGRNPVVLLTSAGTLLLSNCRGASAIYVASLRNVTSTARHLVATHDRVALIGAGTRGQPRPEDQMVCAWIGDRLLQAGYRPQDERTLAEVESWRGRTPEVLRQSPSADFLRGTGQETDLDYVLAHIDDVDEIAIYNGQQVSLVEPGAELGLAAEAN